MTKKPSRGKSKIVCADIEGNVQKFKTVTYNSTEYLIVTIKTHDARLKESKYESAPIPVTPEVERRFLEGMEVDFDLNDRNEAVNVIPSTYVGEIQDVVAKHRDGVSVFFYLKIVSGDDYIRSVERVVRKNEAGRVPMQFEPGDSVEFNWNESRKAYNVELSE